MPTLINPNAAAQNFYNPYNNQYGVSMPSQASASAAIGLSSIVPFVGPLLGAGMNMLAQYSQNQMQKQMFEDYMSPQARMAQMRAAGINPNAVAQGISGSSAPQMNAAAPTGAYTGIGEQLGNSVNTALTAQAIKAGIAKTDAETELTKSLDVKQNIENQYFDRQQQLVLGKLEQDNRISKSTANMLEQDEYYHGVEAAEHCQQTIIATQQMTQELDNMQQEFLNKCAEYQLLLLEQGKTEAETAELWSRVGLNKAMIGEVNARIDNINASTALTYNQSNAQLIENEILGIKAEYEKKAWSVFEQTGFDMKSPVNQNYLRMLAEGKTDDAKQLMNNVYDYSRGQYGAKADQTRKWINTTVGAAATIAGAIMLFVPGLQAAGAVTAGVGIHKLTSGRQSGQRYNYDGDDFSYVE